MVGIGVFRVFKRTRLNIESYSPLKPTKLGFILIGLIMYLDAVHHVTQAVVRGGSKIES